MWKNQFITSSSTSSAGSPVAAWIVSSEPWKRPISQMTPNQVATPAAIASPLPAATGLRKELLAPRKLATIAARTSTVSRPSRKTRIALLSTTVVWLS